MLRKEMRTISLIGMQAIIYTFVSVPQLPASRAHQR
jgi:hypothetical protein